ncbi:uncharacterized protein C8A04DRAFT_33289 [Dichotomopilus funicola]|uniref:Uncharacterized protein n=1 Tax=Dichotomopilus funicola TaxID=1934379 RepID=A0AAN6ZIW5_9PEZI|nr:hypothetical protein C8A04DRAFT_33289 [Dichotomopilus funicola]
MDTAEMIEEKRLKQGFMLATLVSTVAGTFITSINLYDRLVEQRRQKKLDRGQNKRIKELEQRLNEAEEEKERIIEEGSSPKQSKAGDGDRDDFRDSLQQSGKMVQHEYDRCFANLGPKFAEGDLVSQNQIQGQIILLQGSVIKLLEEAVLTGTLPDINKLYNTTEFAREGSIRALRGQYQRLLESATPAPKSATSQRGRPSLIRKISSTPSLRGSTTSSARGEQRLILPPPPSTPQTQLANYSGSNHDSRLFCPCAEELQRTRRPLETVLATDSPSPVCVECGAGAGVGDKVDGCRSWQIEKEVVVRSPREDRRRSLRGPNLESHGGGYEDVMVRTYLLTRRFVFKCHRESSGYACYLCVQHRDRDTVCRSEEGLVSHVTSKHSIREYLEEEDIKELGRALPSLPYR